MGWHFVFQNCKALRGSRYYIQETYLLIDNATSEDAGDYTCKFMHNENGVSYSVTATRSFTFQSKQQNLAQCNICRKNRLGEGGGGGGGPEVGAPLLPSVSISVGISAIITINT